MKEKRPDLPKKNGLDDIPEKKLRERPPKIGTKKKPLETKIRNGFIPAGVNPYKRAEIIKNGCEVK